MSTPFWTTELGITGLTITALVSLLFYIVVSSNRREDKRTKCFQEAMCDMHQMHKEERTEWREDANMRQKQTNEALKELSKAINDMIYEHGHENIKLT
jgi:cytochrome c556